MRAVVQRVSRAQVKVNGQITGQIGRGLLVLLGVGVEDDEQAARYLAEKIVHLRVFEDEEGKMNRSLLETGGAVLAVSQFTLYGDCRKGRRPSFDRAARPGPGACSLRKVCPVPPGAGRACRAGRLPGHDGGGVGE